MPGFTNAKKKINPTFKRTGEVISGLRLHVLFDNIWIESPWRCSFVMTLDFSKKTQIKPDYTDMLVF